MKKTLCLILAFVLVLGLCTIGAGAAFEDAADVQYTAQVETMANLGILKGFEDGSFKPADGVTRAQAAKLIAYMMLGETNAEKMPAKKVFSDVEADHWAAKYINYCYTKNIIAGMGDGSFAPNAPVTATQLAKMLLSAAGYGKNGEFVGSGWDVNVFMTAITVDLFAGSKAEDFDAPATREEASLYVYNTLMNVELVKFSKDTETYEAIKADDTFAKTVWGFETATGILTANEGNTDKFEGKSVIDGKTFEVATDAEQLGHLFNVQYKVADDKNVVYACTEIGSVMTGAEAVAAKVKAATVTNLQNGVASDKLATPAKTDLTGKYVVDAKNVLVAYIAADTYTYGTLAVATDKTTKVTTYKVSGEDVLGAEDMKNGDVVTVKAFGDFTYVYPMTIEEGVKITKKQALTTGGYKYNGGAFTFAPAAQVAALSGSVKVDKVNVTKIATNTELALGKTYNLYKDSNGLVWGYALPTTAPATTDYSKFVMVTAVYDNTGVNSVGQPVGGNWVQAVDADGEIVYYLSTQKAEDIGVDVHGDSYVICTVAENTAKKDFYTFTPADNSVIATATSFAKAVTVRTDDAEIVAVSIATDSDMAGRASKLTVKAMDELPVGSEVVYTYASEKAGTATVKVVKTAWVLTVGSGDSTFNGEGYVFLTAAQATNTDLAEQSIREDGKTVKTYKGYLNGELIDMTYVADKNGVYSNFANFDAGFHKYYVNANGEYVLDSKKQGPQDVIELTSDDVMILDGKIYLVDAEDIVADLEDVLFVDITAKKTENLVEDLDALIEALMDDTLTVTLDLAYERSNSGVYSIMDVIYVTTADVA